MKNLPFLFLLLFFAACKSDDIGVEFTNYQLGVPFELKVGELVMGEEIFGPLPTPAIHLEEIVEERCPCNAICGVGGLVTARLNVNGEAVAVKKGDKVRGFNIPETHDGYIYTLQAVAPCPTWPDYDIPQEDYVIELLVEKE